MHSQLLAYTPLLATISGVLALPYHVIHSTSLPEVGFSYIPNKINNNLPRSIVSSTVLTPPTMPEMLRSLISRLHTLGFIRGVLACLALFWWVVGLTVGMLVGVGAYTRWREKRGRRQRRRERERERERASSIGMVRVEVRRSTRVPGGVLLTSPKPRSRPLSPKQTSPKSVHWADLLLEEQSFHVDKGVSE